MITVKNESKILTKDISCEYKYNLMEENVIQIKTEIMVNVDANVKDVIYVKMTIFGNLLDIVAKTENI